MVYQSNWESWGDYGPSNKSVHGFFNFGKALSSKELGAFLDLLPDSYLGGVDTYDLIDNLMLSNRLFEAKTLAQRVQFSWQWRMRFMRMKIKMWLS